MIKRPRWHLKRYPWTVEQDDYLRAHYEKEGAQACTKHMPHTVQAIWRRAAVVLGLYRDRSVKHIDLNLVKTPIFAYILGFLWADGHLTRGHNGVTMAIQREDGDAILPLMQSLGSWSTRVATYKAGKHQRVFSVWDRDFANLLRGWGYEDKSKRGFELVLAHLGPELTPYFIHGFFDGDGNMDFSLNNKHRIRLSGAHDVDWTCMTSILKEAGISRTRVTKHVTPTGCGSTVVIERREDVLRFYRIFIHHEVSGLPRKRAKFNAFIDDLRKRQAAKRAFPRTRNGKRVTAQGHLGHKGVYLGTYDTEEQAQKALSEWEDQHAPDHVQERRRIQAELDLLIST